MVDKGIFEQLNNINMIELDGMLARWRDWHENLGPWFNTFIVTIFICFLVGSVFFANSYIKEENRIEAAQSNGTFDLIKESEQAAGLANDPEWQARKAYEEARYRQAQEDIKRSGGFVYEYKPPQN